MPPLAGYWHSLLAKHGQVWKAAYKEASRALEAKLSGRVPPPLEYVYARSQRQAAHPIARLRQSQSGWTSAKRHFSSAVRFISTEAGATKAAGRSRVSYQSATWNAIRASPGRAPFASTLRPNMTGGTLGRTAGGYSLGAGRTGAPRYFSHSAASQQHVVQNVSQAVRAFLLGGQKAQFNGPSRLTGGNRYKAVTKLQDSTVRKMRELPRTTPGTQVRFGLNPTVTALTQLQGVPGYTDEQHLNTEGLLDVLSTDFSRQLQELCAVLTDLKKLAALGDLPITYEQSSLKIHFPGCDVDTVERLCQELDVKRGLVEQDEDFDSFIGTEMALLFPFAPSESVSEAEELFHHEPVKPPKNASIDWQDMLTPSVQSSEYSTRSAADAVDDGDQAWTVHSCSDEAYSSAHSPLEYQGIEGIYRFIEQCDSIRR